MRSCSKNEGSRIGLCLHCRCFPFRPRYIGNLVRRLPIVEAPGITMGIPQQLVHVQMYWMISQFLFLLHSQFFRIIFLSAVPSCHQLSIFAASLFLPSLGQNIILFRRIFSRQDFISSSKHIKSAFCW